MDPAGGSLTALATSDRDIRNHAAFIWSVADKLRGVYKQSEYGRVILPLVVLPRLDCVLEPSKHEVLERNASLKGRVENVAPILKSITGVDFYNTSPLDFRRVLDDPGNVAGHLRTYIAGFSPDVRDVFEKFGLDPHITRLERANLLYLVVFQFRRDRPPPERRLEPGDGLPLRGAPAQVLRTLERGGGPPLHTA